MTLARRRWPTLARSVPAILALAVFTSACGAASAALQVEATSTTTPAAAPAPPSTTAPAPVPTAPAVGGVVTRNLGTGQPDRASSITMLSEAGDYIGGGATRVFDVENSTIAVDARDGAVTVRVSGGTLADDFNLQFVPPEGATLDVGSYDDATRAPFQTGLSPGLSISGDGRGCNELSGSFEVRDVRWNRTGAVSRAWITFEQHCEGQAPALFGEVRIDEPGVATGIEMAPSALVWPQQQQGASPTVFPVTVLNLTVAPLAISSSELTGPSARDFAIRGDECSGTTVASGGGCQVFVRFTPKSPGARDARLIVRARDGRLFPAYLGGSIRGGVIAFTYRSEPGDPVGGGAAGSFTVADADITVNGTRSSVGFGATPAGGDAFGIRLEATPGDILAPGSYRLSAGGPSAQLDRTGFSCTTVTGTFSIAKITAGLDGSVTGIDASFDLHCDGAPGAFAGRIRYLV